jgi:hypothetical protein
MVAQTCSGAKLACWLKPFWAAFRQRTWLQILRELMKRLVAGTVLPLLALVLTSRWVYHGFQPAPQACGEPQHAGRRRPQR